MIQIILNDTILLSHDTNCVNNRFYSCVALYKCESFKKSQKRESLFYCALNRAVHLGLVKTLTLFFFNHKLASPTTISLFSFNGPKTMTWRTATKWTLRVNDDEVNCESEMQEQDNRRFGRSKQCGRCTPTLLFLTSIFMNGMHAYAKMKRQL